MVPDAGPPQLIRVSIAPQRLELEKLREEASRALAKEDVVPNIGLQVRTRQLISLIHKVIVRVVSGVLGSVKIFHIGVSCKLKHYQQGMNPPCRIPPSVSRTSYGNTWKLNRGDYFSSVFTGPTLRTQHRSKKQHPATNG